MTSGPSNRPNRPSPLHALTPGKVWASSARKARPRWTSGSSRPAWEGVLVKRAWSCSFFFLGEGCSFWGGERLVWRAFSPTAGSFFGVSGGSTRVPQGFHESSPRVPREFPEVLRGLPLKRALHAVGDITRAFFWGGGLSFFVGRKKSRLEGLYFFGRISFFQRAFL